MPERITRDPITGEYIADLSPDAQINTTLEGITKKEYDILIDSFKNHPEYFDNDYAGAYPEGFGEAVIKVFTQTFAFGETFDRMSPEQKLNMFRNTNKNREKKMSEIKELGIKKDLFDGGILSSEEMTPENVFSGLSGLINKPPAASTAPGAPSAPGAQTAPKGPLKKQGLPFKIKGGAWPVSSIFSMTTRNEELSYLVPTGSVLATNIGLSSAWLTGATSYSTYAIGFLTVIGIPAGIYLALELSCTIANQILESNGIMRSHERNGIMRSHQVRGDNLTGPIEIIKKWFEKGKIVWGILGDNRRAPIQEMPEMPEMPEYNGSILDYIGSRARNVAGRVGNVAGHLGNIIIQKMSQPGFALFGTICTVGDIATNLITAPFYGFAYLAKKMLGRNIGAVVPVDEEPENIQGEVNPLAPIDLHQREMTPIDRYTKNINIFNEKIYGLKGEYANQYDILQKKLDSKYKTCSICMNHICNNGRYIKCKTCFNGVFHYDNIIGGCNFANNSCTITPSVKNCPMCRSPWQLCTDNQLILLPETNTNKGFSVIDGPCLVSDSVALTDNEIIADNKILIGILDRNLNEEHKDEIAREPENELDVRVNLKTSNDELNDMVSTDVRTKPSGGSKKRKNNTKRRRNKKTRRRRR